ncbi:MAG: O-antigen ligase family protein, partial [Polyangiaceae bacterium]
PAVFDPPYARLGALLLTHMNTVDSSMSWCPLSGLDFCFVVLGIVFFYRRSTGSQLDSAERLATPRPLLKLAWVALGSILYCWLSGLLRGGDFGMSLWQVNKVIYLPVLFLLFQGSLRGPKDQPAIARVVLLAAVYKALLATYVIHNFHGPMDPETGSDRLAVATTHADSMLFADAFVMLLAALLERIGGKTKWYALAIFPILISGMLANGRRLVWVHVALVCITVYIVAEDNPAKRFIRRSLAALSPVAALYVLIGWNSGGGGIFKPVKMLRSVVDAKSDGSTFWREMENYDIISTFRMNPIFGTGFGHGYIEFVQLPAIGYLLERYVPHNGILGLWCYCGYFGYAALTLLWSGGVYFAMRAYHASKVPWLRAGALVSFGAVLIYFQQAWGDIGLGSWTGVFTAACAIANSGKLGVATGQWGNATKKRAPGPATSAAS